jgi:hypothetical protein
VARLSIPPRLLAGSLVELVSLRVGHDRPYRRIPSRGREHLSGVTKAQGYHAMACIDMVRRISNIFQAKLIDFQSYLAKMQGPFYSLPLAFNESN